MSIRSHATLNLTPGVFSRRLAVVGFLGSLVLSSGAPAATILATHRDLQAVVEILDFNPIAGNEASDLKSNGANPASYNDTATTTNQQNDNSGTATATQSTTLDLTGLKFGGTGSSRYDAVSNLDANDVANGAFISMSGFCQYSVNFRIASSGKLTLSGNLQGGSSTALASVRVEKLDGSGVALWSREISAGSISFNADLTLPKGDYLVYITATTGQEITTAGAQAVAGNAGFSWQGQIVESSGGGKKK